MASAHVDGVLDLTFLDIKEEAGKEKAVLIRTSYSNQNELKHLKSSQN